jgi:eukaryotic-like serine/threonine-protein kinase
MRRKAEERVTGPPTGAGELAPGTRIGAELVIEELLAEGGMSRVYRASDRNGVSVAVKVLRSELSSPRHAVERLAVEARACAELAAANLPKLLGTGSLADGAPYVVRTYFPGSTLLGTLVGGKFTIAGVLQLGSELATALQGLHQRGLVHCDLNPSNVILMDRGEAGARAVAALVDFASCRRVDSTPAGGAAPAVGTLAYMAPEQLGGGPVDARTDVYSLGILLYECLTGRRPASFQEALAPPCSLRFDCPPELERAVLRALARAPDARWASARRLGDELAWLQARSGLGFLRSWREEHHPERVTAGPPPGVSGVRRRNEDE